MRKDSFSKPRENWSRVAIFVGVAFAASGVGALAKREASSIGEAFGNALMISSIFLFVLAWLIYLKFDGVDFLKAWRQNRTREAPESWKDRVPKLGSPPSLPYRILNPGELENTPSELKKRSGRALIRDCILAGIVAFALSVIFQYAVG